MDQVETLSERVRRRWGRFVRTKNMRTWISWQKKKHKEQKNCSLLFIWTLCCVLGGAREFLWSCRSCCFWLLASFFFFFKCPPASNSFLQWRLSVTYPQDGASHPSPPGTFGGEAGGRKWFMTIANQKGSGCIGRPRTVGPHQDRDSLFNFYWLCNISIRSATDISKLCVWGLESLGRGGEGWLWNVTILHLSFLVTCKLVSSPHVYVHMEHSRTVNLLLSLYWSSVIICLQLFTTFKVTLHVSDVKL